MGWGGGDGVQGGGAKRAPCRDRRAGGPPLVRGYAVPSRVSIPTQPRAPAVSRFRARRVPAERHRPDGAPPGRAAGRAGTRLGSGPRPMQDPSLSYVGARRELALQLVHATEAAALTCAAFLGRAIPSR